MAPAAEQDFTNRRPDHIRRQDMGLMDKVKEQATVLAQKTQDTARDSRAKLDQVQARRRADAMLRDLGVAVYAERTGRSTAETDSKIDKLVADLTAFETEHGASFVGLRADDADHEPDGKAGSPDDEGSDGEGSDDEGSDDGGTTMV
jgi:hypothetical protein